MKRCSKCKVEKPFEGFYFSGGRPLARCRSCYREYARTRPRPTEYIVPALKKCPGCAIWKDAAAYNKTRRRKDGLQFYCRQCCSNQLRAKPRRPPDYKGAKPCSSCGKTVPRSGYHRNGFTPDGLAHRCKQCARAIAQQFRQPDRDRRRNRDAYRRLTPASKAQRKGNVSDRKSWDSRRRARFLSAPGRHTEEQLAARAALWGGQCAYCPLPAKTFDHTIPLARGGSNWPANLRPVCRHCNSSKLDRKPHEWTDRIWDYTERRVTGELAALFLWNPSAALVVRSLG